MISKKYHTWKIQLIHSKTDNIELIINDKVDEVTEELFQSLLSRYQIGFETLLKGSDFISNHENLLQCQCHRMNFKLGVSKTKYIDSRAWIKNKQKQ